MQNTIISNEYCAAICVVLSFSFSSSLSFFFSEIYFLATMLLPIIRMIILMNLLIIAVKWKCVLNNIIKRKSSRKNEFEVGRCIRRQLKCALNWSILNELQSLLAKREKLRQSAETKMRKECMSRQTKAFTMKASLKCCAPNEKNDSIADNGQDNERICVKLLFVHIFLQQATKVVKRQCGNQKRSRRSTTPSAINSSINASLQRTQTFSIKGRLLKDVSSEVIKWRGQ